MEIAKLEMTAIEEVMQDVATCDARELNELQLALAGGGFADPIFA